MSTKGVAPERKEEKRIVSTTSCENCPDNYSCPTYQENAGYNGGCFIQASEK